MSPYTPSTKNMTPTRSNWSVTNILCFLSSCLEVVGNLYRAFTWHTPTSLTINKPLLFSSLMYTRTYTHELS